MRILHAVLIAGTVLASAAAVAQPLPYAPIPPLQIEPGPPPPPPGPAARYVLEPGHWHWNGGRYVWVPRH